jgi:hypothetical protein
VAGAVVVAAERGQVVLQRLAAAAVFPVVIHVGVAGGMRQPGNTQVR